MSKPTKKSKKTVRDSLANLEVLLSTFHSLRECDKTDLLKKFFELRKTEDGYSGYLYPSEDSGIFAYGHPFLKVKIQILAKRGLHTLCFSISSIDDSGVSVFGPEESLEDAKKRVLSVLNFVSSLEFKCPSKNLLVEFCHKNSLEIDFW